MREIFVRFAFLLSGLIHFAGGGHAAESNKNGGVLGKPPRELTLRYHPPVTTWMTEALPVGNGSFGGMIFGGTQTEPIQVNVDSLWTGDDIKDMGSYQNPGDFHVEFGPAHATGGADYYRGLDIAQSIHTVRCTTGDVAFAREAFFKTNKTEETAKRSLNSNATAKMAKQKRHRVFPFPDLLPGVFSALSGKQIHSIRKYDEELESKEKIECMLFPSMTFTGNGNQCHAS